MVARNSAMLPDRRVLPEVALSRAPAPLTSESPAPLPALKPLPAIDVAALELDPVVPPQPTATGRARREIVMAGSKAAAHRAAPRRVDVAVPAARPAPISTFRSAFDGSLEAPAQIGLTVPGTAMDVSVGPEAAPLSPAPTTSEVASPAAGGAEPAQPVADTAVPRLDPSAGQYFPAAPVQETPAELPAAA